MSRKPRRVTRSDYLVAGRGLARDIAADVRSMPFAVMVTPTNGTGEYAAARFANFMEAVEYCRYSISYTGDRVKRVEVAELGNGRRAVWDASWDERSKHAGLWESVTWA